VDWYSVRRDAHPADVAAIVDRFGVARIEGFLPGSVVDRVAEETTTLFDEPAEWAHPEPYSVGRSVRVVRRELDKRRYPAIDDLFAMPWLEDVVARYYCVGYVYGEQFYGILDGVRQQHVVQELHYDKVQHLKTFFYLSDVDNGTGPFHCVPGSHRYCASLQTENRQQRRIPTDAEVRVLPDSFADDAIPVLGGRGTLIVFDSDIAHRACTPTERPRLAIRSLNWGPDSLGTRV
jgi:Phytanoyl-CoA dioxygenase (PhyH)